jgi:hypothetical protein
VEEREKQNAHAAIENLRSGISIGVPGKDYNFQCVNYVVLALLYLDMIHTL